MMKEVIDIRDREDLNQRLSDLKPDTPSKWGNFKAQNIMVEHLMEAVQYSNGKKIADLRFPLEQAQEMKQFMVYSEHEMPKDQKGFLSDSSLSLKFGDMDLAKKELNKELDDFESFFNKNATVFHHAFGDMNYNEWIMWHNKHFTHHFKQFKLI